MQLILLLYQVEERNRRSVKMKLLCPKRNNSLVMFASFRGFERSIAGLDVLCSKKLWKGKGQSRDNLQCGEEVRIKPGFSNAQSFPCPLDCPPICSFTCQDIKKLDATLGLPLACVDY